MRYEVIRALFEILCWGLSFLAASPLIVLLIYVIFELTKIFKKKTKKTDSAKIHKNTVRVRPRKISNSPCGNESNQKGDDDIAR